MIHRQHGEHFPPISTEVHLRSVNYILYNVLRNQIRTLPQLDVGDFQTTVIFCRRRSYMKQVINIYLMSEEISKHN